MVPGRAEYQRKRAIHSEKRSSIIMALGDVQEGPAIARKVGEGFGRPDADAELPLDIAYNKLTDWLVPLPPSPWPGFGLSAHKST